MPELTDVQKDAVLYFHDSLLEIVHRSGMTPAIATPAVLMLACTLCAACPMEDKDIIDEFTRVLKQRQEAIAMKQKEGKPVQ